MQAEYWESRHDEPQTPQQWYRVLVHDAIHETYVAERNLERDTSGAPVRHPSIV
ncbi:hemimethylated DNA-binding YccV-like domain-containing protein [Pseudomonadota bacterium]